MTLLQENPDSRVATAWIVERGVLPQPKHNQLLKKYNAQKKLMKQEQVDALQMVSYEDIMRRRVPVKKSNRKKMILIHQRPRALKKRP